MGAGAAGVHDALGNALVIEMGDLLAEDRGNGIPRLRDKRPKIAFRPETVSAETETQPQKPAIAGFLTVYGKSRG